VVVFARSLLDECFYSLRVLLCFVIPKSRVIVALIVTVRMPKFFVSRFKISI